MSTGSWTRPGFARLHSPVIVAGLALLLQACGGEVAPARAPVDQEAATVAAQAYSVSGFVGNPSVSGAEITLVSRDGAALASAISDTNARYTISVTDTPPAPFKVVAGGGSSLVSGLPVPVELVAAAFGEPEVMNLSHLGTLAVNAADCGGSLTRQTIDTAWASVADSAGIPGFPNPTNASLSADATAELMRADAAFEEALRRSVAALAHLDVSAKRILDQLACDLGDNGRMDLSHPTADDRIAISLLAARAATLTEVVAGDPHIGGQPAGPMLDAVLQAILPEGTRWSGSIGDLPASNQLIGVARSALAVLISELRDSELLDLVLALDGNSDPRPAVRQLLDAAHLDALWSLPGRLAAADNGTIQRLHDRMNELVTAMVPIVSFAVSESQVGPDDPIVLSWASAGADRCAAGDGWTGERPVEGALTVPAPQASTTYRLACTGLGGTTTAFVTVTVGTAAEPAPESSPDPAPEPDPTSEPAPEPSPDSAPTPAPTVSLAADDPIVDAGATTTLRWTATDASGCTASGAWSGSWPASGSASIGPLDSQSTFSLNCTGSGGSAIAMVSVRVNGPIALSWVAPTENVDGSPLTDLAGYRVYYGTASRSYVGQAQIDDPTATSTTLTVPSGDYFVAMTALDADGNESAYSNEVLKNTP